MAVVAVEVLVEYHLPRVHDVPILVHPCEGMVVEERHRLWCAAAMTVARRRGRVFRSGSRRFRRAYFSIGMLVLKVSGAHARSSAPIESSPTVG